MSAELIDGKKIAKKIRADIAQEVARLRKHYGIVPQVTTLSFGEDADAELYLKRRDKACDEVGIKGVGAVTVTPSLLNNLFILPAIKVLPNHQHR